MKLGAQCFFKVLVFAENINVLTAKNLFVPKLKRLNMLLWDTSCWQKVPLGHELFLSQNLSVCIAKCFRPENCCFFMKVGTISPKYDTQRYWQDMRKEQIKIKNLNFDCSEIKKIKLKKKTFKAVLLLSLASCRIYRWSFFAVKSLAFPQASVFKTTEPGFALLLIFYL